MHEHGHGHAAPLTEINETLILQWHKPTPPSYGTHDFDDKNVTSKHPGLMGLHALFMSLAFFGALPIGTFQAHTRTRRFLGFLTFHCCSGIALRSVNHAWHAVSVAAFYVFAVLGVSCSALYSKLTPNMCVQSRQFSVDSGYISAFAPFCIISEYRSYESMKYREHQFHLVSEK